MHTCIVVFSAVDIIISFQTYCDFIGRVHDVDTFVTASRCVCEPWRAGETRSILFFMFNRRGHHDIKTFQTRAFDSTGAVKRSVFKLAPKLLRRSQKLFHLAPKLYHLTRKVSHLTPKLAPGEKMIPSRYKVIPMRTGNIPSRPKIIQYRPKVIPPRS
jgi:hypothetical protein